MDAINDALNDLVETASILADNNQSEMAERVTDAVDQIDSAVPNSTHAIVSWINTQCATEETHRELPTVVDTFESEIDAEEQLRELQNNPNANAENYDVKRVQLHPTKAVCPFCGRSVAVTE